MLGALVVALAALPVVFFLARSLSRPLVQMTRAIEAFARGITVPSPVNAGGEIGVLATVVHAHGGPDARPDRQRSRARSRTAGGSSTRRST